MLSVPSLERCRKSVEERMQGQTIIFLSVLTTGLRAACSLADAAALIWTVVMQDRCGMNRILAYGYTDILHTTVLLYLTRHSSHVRETVRKLEYERHWEQMGEREVGRGGIEKFHVAFKGTMHGKRQTWHGLNF